MKTPKQPKFNFEEMKTGATSQNPAVRKKAFEEYFERFEEFPSYLFDNSQRIDSQLLQTIQDLIKDPETSKTMQKAIATLMQRLPSVENLPTQTGAPVLGNV
jgi:hypothetical protein